jgi:hypothetical protein
VLVAVGAFVLWPGSDPGSAITRQNFGRIIKWFDDGNWNGMPPMTVADVTAILGTPPGDYRTGRSLYPTGGGFMSDGPLFRGAIYWRCDTHEIYVTADASGRVKSIGNADLTKSPDAFGNLLWRAKRQWRRWFPE